MTMAYNHFCKIHNEWSENTCESCDNLEPPNPKECKECGALLDNNNECEDRCHLTCKYCDEIEDVCLCNTDDTERFYR